MQSTTIQWRYDGQSLQTGTTVPLMSGLHLARLPPAPETAQHLQLELTGADGQTQTSVIQIVKPDQ